VGQATCIAPLQPFTLAAFQPWGIQRELVVQDLSRRKGKGSAIVFNGWIQHRCFLPAMNHCA